MIYTPVAELTNYGKSNKETKLLNLLNKYITGNDKTRETITETLKTEPYRLKRRQIEDRIRKNPLDFLKALAALDIERSLR